MFEADKENPGQGRPGRDIPQHSSLDGEQFTSFDPTAELEGLILKQIDEFGGEWSWEKTREAHKNLIDSLARLGAPPYKPELWERYRELLEPGFESAVSKGLIEPATGQADNTPQDEKIYKRKSK